MLSAAGKHEYQRLCENNEANSSAAQEMLARLEARRTQFLAQINEAFDGARQEIEYARDSHAAMCQDVANQIMRAEEVQHENHDLKMKVQELAANF